MANNDEEIRRRNKDSAQRAALFWIELANKRESELAGHLFTLSAVILPLSTSIVLSSIELDWIEKILLVFSWLFFIVSISFGFSQIIIDIKYFVKLSRDSSKREDLWSDSNRSYIDIDRDVTALGKVPGSSTGWPLYVQGITFIVAFIILIIIAILILFTPMQY